MADPLTVVGAIASTIQLIEFTGKVFDRLHGYIRHIDEVPEVLRKIKLHLPLFIETLQRVQTFMDLGYFNPRTSLVLKDFVDEGYTQMVLLDDLLVKITPDHSDSMMKKACKAIFSLKEERTLEKIFENVSGYIEKLLLFQSSVHSSHAMIHTKSLLIMHQNHMASADSDTLSLESTRPMLESHTSMPGVKSNTDTRSKNLTSYSKGGKDRQLLSYFFSLSRFGLLWALQVDLNISWGNRVSILPGLHFQQLVKHTSPGSVIFFKYMVGFLDAESASQSLIRLFRRGVVSPHDVFPDGESWLERVIKKQPGSFPLHAERVKLMLRVLCQCGALLGQNKPLLSLIASCDGDHMLPLRELIALGYDCSADSTLSTSARAHLPLGEDQISDPFLLEFLAESSENAYGVWGQTILMDTILCGSSDEIGRMVQEPMSLEGTNDLGQSPVHVAILRPNALSLIVQVYKDLDLPDNRGKTPLDYAAAYGSAESLLILLEAGANPEYGQKIPFLLTASRFSQWELVSKAILFFRSKRTFSDEFLQEQINNLSWPGFMRGFFNSEEIDNFLKSILTLDLDKYPVSKQGDTLLHHAASAANVEALFPTASEYIDVPNKDGQTALMTSIKYRRFGASRMIVQRGCDINHQDTLGWSALHISSRGLWNLLPMKSGTGHPDIESFSLISSTFTIISMLIANGADPFSRDDSRCACTDAGRSPVTLILQNFSLSDAYGNLCAGYHWVLEWLLILSDLRGQATARKSLLDLIRLKEFQKVELTHVCAIPDYFESKLELKIDGNEIDEILDEEREIIQELDETMEEWKRKLDHLPIEETWLGMIIEFQHDRDDVPDPMSMSDWWASSSSWRHHFGDSVRTLDLLPGFTTSTSNSSNAKRFCIDEASDEYWVIQQDPLRYLSAPSQAYLAWVEYFYKHRAQYDYPVEIDHGWYERRKYWADRQSEVLSNCRVSETSE